MKYVIIPTLCFIYKITRQSLYCITTTAIRITSYVSLQRSTPHSDIIDYHTASCLIQYCRLGWRLCLLVFIWRMSSEEENWLGPYLKTNSELYTKTNEWQTITHDPIQSLLKSAQVWTIFVYCISTLLLRSTPLHGRPIKTRFHCV